MFFCRPRHCPRCSLSVATGAPPSSSSPRLSPVSALATALAHRDRTVAHIDLGANLVLSSRHRCRLRPPWPQPLSITATAVTFFCRKSSITLVASILHNPSRSLVAIAVVVALFYRRGGSRPPWPRSSSTATAVEFFVHGSSTTLAVPYPPLLPSSTAGIAIAITVTLSLLQVHSWHPRPPQPPWAPPSSTSFMCSRRHRKRKDKKKRWRKMVGPTKRIKYWGCLYRIRMVF